MRIIVLITIVILQSSFVFKPSCDNQKVYVLKSQFQLNNSLQDYPVIESKKDYLKFKGGNRKLEKLIFANLQLSEIAKNEYFFANLLIKVDCEGKVIETKFIGKYLEKYPDWIVLKSIDWKLGDWIPAKFENKPVTAIYFMNFFVSGPSHK